jgi:retinol dehydrogenase-12
MGSQMTAEDIAKNVNLDNKVVLVTGGTSGIGFESCRVFAKAGALVIMAGRSLDKLTKAIADIKEKLPKAQVVPLMLDLSSLESIKKAAEEVKAKFKKIDILLNNAGVMACPLTRTIDGHEMQFGTNHLGHFALTLRLYPLINKEGGRIVNVSSAAHTMGGTRLRVDDLDYIKNDKEYSPWPAYQQSKLANVLFTSELNKRSKDKGDNITAYSLHPGIIHTELTRHVGWQSSWESMSKTIGQGAATSMYCALSPKAVQGGYHSDCEPCEPHACAKISEDGEALWVASEKMAGLNWADC